MLTRLVYALLDLYHDPDQRHGEYMSRVIIGTKRVWDALGQNHWAEDLVSRVQRSNVTECVVGVQSSEVARMYARRAETRFLGKFVYDSVTMHDDLESLQHSIMLPCESDDSLSLQNLG